MYLFKINNRNTREKCEICSTLTTKTPERRQRRSGAFIVKVEHISFPFSRASIVDFEQVIVSRVSGSVFRILLNNLLL